MNILLTCLLITTLAIFALIVYAFVKIGRVYRDFIAFVTPEADGKPSPLALTASGMSDMLARSLVASVKTTFMGIQSGANRAEAAEQAELAVDVASQSNPLIGAVVTQFPALKKALKKNPALLDLAIQQFMRSRGPGSMPAPAGSVGPGDNHRTQFNMKI